MSARAESYNKAGINQKHLGATSPMLISCKHRFIFIANPKAASTSMELALRPFSEICFMEPPSLKHLPFSEVMQKFSWMFDQIPLSKFFVFGVMRHPVGLILSLFNSHTNDAFKDRPYLYTGDMNFDDFIADWCTRNADQIALQYNRFLDWEGTIFANYIISYHNLELGFEHVKSITGTQGAGALPRANTSDYKIFPRDLTPGQLAWIRERFEEDIEFMSLYCDRPLSREECEMQQQRNTPSAAIAVRASTRSRHRQPTKTSFPIK